ncbi:MAG TPA: universal stress protein [Pyrinomonadaceae bacterium]|nr:universal stress protein [Pyrinomonadaceae bacterium]
MIKLERILCPTDLSTESDEALRYAVALTRAYEAKLYLLHCSEALPNGYEGGKQARTRITRLFTESLAPHLDLAELSDLNWEGLVAKSVSDVARAIVEKTGKHNIDLIVMRSRRRPRAAMLLGSTAEAVCRTAPCPVLVTHPREREWVGLSTGEIDLRRVLVAYDFSTDSELALNYGASLAQEYQAEVHLLHVSDNVGTVEPGLAWAPATTTGAGYVHIAQKLQQAIPKEVFLWCNLVTAIRYGRAYEEVLLYAKEKEIDLICMGASGSDFVLGKLFGSNVDRVLREAPCPVLVARPIKPAASSAPKHRKQTS